MKLSSTLLISVGLSVGVGILTWAFLSRRNRARQESAHTERVIWDILEAFGEHRPAPGTPLH